jgi:hypothetical protein
MIYLNWWDKIKPDCCNECGNYINHLGIKGYERPCKIRCWKSLSGDCRRNPNKATIEQMKTRTIFIRNTDPTKECAICLKPMKGRFIKKIFCGHTFHSKCLSLWEEKKKSCPMCRFDYTPPPDPDELREDLKEAKIEFINSYYNWKLIVEPLIQLPISHPGTDKLIELWDAFDQLLDEYDDYYETHNRYCRFVSERSISLSVINKYRWVCIVMGPLTNSAIQSRYDAGLPNLIVRGLERARAIFYS